MGHHPLASSSLAAGTLKKSPSSQMTANPIPHQARNHTSAPGSNYLLPSDESERHRLDYQHGLFTRCFGSKLVLSPVTLNGGDKVLDCATGACSWLLDFVSTISNDIEVFGFDIETNLFPAKLPHNVKLFNASVLDLPKEWSDTFQLVHQRLLISALTSEQWGHAVKELFRVTKPGGWAELCEVGPDFVCPAQPGHKCLELYKTLFATSGHVIDIAPLLPDRLREAGFTDVHSVKVDLPFGKQYGRDGELARNTYIEYMGGLKTPILNRGGLGLVESEEEYDEIVKDFERICDETLGAGTTFYTVYGRKPLVADSTIAAAQN